MDRLMRANPPPLVPTIDRAPVNEAPSAILITAISSSAWRYLTVPAFTISERIVDAGVIGYAEKNSNSDAIAPCTRALFPYVRDFFVSETENFT